MPQQPPDHPLPGWYPDGQRGLRWWDGHAWGQFAPPAGGFARPMSEVDAGKSMSILAHLGCLYGGFIGPMIIYLTQKDKNRFTRHHAREALNFQLTVLAAMIPLVVGYVISIASFIASTPGPNDFPTRIFVFFPIFGGVMLASLGFGIYGAVQASRGVWWTYPVRIAFVHDPHAPIPPTT